MSSETGSCTIRASKHTGHTGAVHRLRVRVGLDRPYVVNCSIMGSNQIIAALNTKLWKLCCIPALQWSYCLGIKTRGCYKGNERWRERACGGEDEASHQHSLHGSAIENWGNKTLLL